MNKLIVADIGGSNSRFAVFETNNKKELSLSRKIWLNTSESKSFEDLLCKLYQKDFEFSINKSDVVVISVPGPVENESFASLANVKWEINISPLRDKFGVSKVFLVNDFIAQGYACLTEAVKNAQNIQRGKLNYRECLAVVGAGTGLGYCALKPNGFGGFTSFPSESGHANFSFVGNDEIKYQQFILKELKLPFVTNEIVVSGPGLSLLHRFLTGENLTPKIVVNKISPHPKTTKWFSLFYGRVCRNYALSVLPIGSIYITGGVAIKNPFLVDSDIFRNEFLNSPQKGNLLKKIPIFLNQNENSGLWGAAFYGVLKMGR